MGEMEVQANLSCMVSRSLVKPSMRSIHAVPSQLQWTKDTLGVYSE